MLLSAAELKSSRQFWDSLSIEKEVGDGKRICDAALTTKDSLKTFLWSGLENISKGTNGKYKHVLHFDGKVCAMLAFFP